MGTWEVKGKDVFSAKEMDQLMWHKPDLRPVNCSDCRFTDFSWGICSYDGLELQYNVKRECM